MESYRSSILSSCSTQDDISNQSTPREIEQEQQIMNRLLQGNQRKSSDCQENTEKTERKLQRSPEGKQKVKKPLKMFGASEKKQSENCDKKEQNDDKTLQGDVQKFQVTKFVLKLLFFPLYLIYVVVKVISEKYLFGGIVKLFKKILKTGSTNSTSKVQGQKQNQKINKLDLVLDLDETLIHSSKTRISEDQTHLKLDRNGQEQSFYVSQRPFLNQFLTKLSNNYNIIIYTASKPDYANLVINQIVDPAKEIIQKCFYRDSCTKTESNSLSKSLSNILKNEKRVKENSIFIDNCLQNLQEDYDNSFLISTYKGEQNDDSLFNYMHILEGIILQYNEQQKNLQNLIKKAKLRFE